MKSKKHRMGCCVCQNPFAAHFLLDADSSMTVWLTAWVWWVDVNNTQHSKVTEDSPGLEQLVRVSWSLKKKQHLIGDLIQKLPCMSPVTAQPTSPTGISDLAGKLEGPCQSSYNTNNAITGDAALNWLGASELHGRVPSLGECLCVMFVQSMHHGAFSMCRSSSEASFHIFL